MNIGNTCLAVFEKSTHDYHRYNDVDHVMENPFPSSQFEHLLYKKNYIDAVQWHLEDIVRDPNISPDRGLMIKRRIDQSNQDRTDLVEKIDDYFLNQFEQVNYKGEAKINTESPAWAIDRLSILVLKIYHMKEQVLRTDVDSMHVQKCQQKLEILNEQKEDLSKSIDELIADIAAGNRQMKVYRQMKMYNDPALNPALYSSSK
jgi:hypothetical protein